MAVDPEYRWMSSMDSLVRATWHRPISGTAGSRTSCSARCGALRAADIGLDFNAAFEPQVCRKLGVAQSARPGPTQIQMMHDEGDVHSQPSCRP
jgi:hypothetical protein